MPDVLRAAKYARWMNAPSCVKRMRIAITLLLAMAKQTMAWIKQVHAEVNEPCWQKFSFFANIHIHTPNTRKYTHTFI